MNSNYFILALRNVVFLFALTILFACNHKAQKGKYDGKAIRDIPYPKAVSDQRFGDTLRVVTEKRGDTLIKHFIDLKEGRDDKFDDSYSAEWITTFKPADTIVELDKKRIKIKGYVIENYTTDFSGSEKTSVITAKGDTLFLSHSIYIE